MALTDIGELNETTSLVIKAAIEVHRCLGPGLLESAYHACLVFELRSMGLSVETSKPLPLRYKGMALDCGYRIDLIVSGSVIVELKCVEHLAPIHSAQLLTYLRLTGCRAGLLLNFKVPVLKNGIRRLLNTGEARIPPCNPASPCLRGDVVPCPSSSSASVARQ